MNGNIKLQTLLIVRCHITHTCYRNMIDNLLLFICINTHIYTYKREVYTKYGNKQ